MSMSETISVCFGRGAHGRVEMKRGVAPESSTKRDVPRGRVPRISRLMALAIRFEQLVRSGEARDFAELARLGRISRARMSQIVNLLNLASDLQAELLMLPAVERGDDPITERDVRPIATVIDWAMQRRMWRELRQRIGDDGGVKAAPGSGGARRERLINAVPVNETEWRRP